MTASFEMRRGGYDVQRGALVEVYVSEAIRMRRFPGIAFRGEDFRRAWIEGSGLDVWELVANLREFPSEDDLAGDFGLTKAQIRVATAYYNEFQHEIESLIARGRPDRETFLTRHPFITPLEDIAATGG